MNKSQLVLGLLAILAIMWISDSASGSGGLEREWIELPVSPPEFVLVDDAGNVVSEHPLPKLEFRSLLINVARSDHSATGHLIPQSICESAVELRAILPADIHDRMMVWSQTYEDTGTVNQDPAVGERLNDLAVFLLEIWDLRREDHPISSGLFERKIEIVVTDSLDFLLKLLAAQSQCPSEP